MSAAHALPRLHQVAATAWRRWFLDRHAEFWLGELGLSLTRMQARVVEIIEETVDTRTFVLAPDRKWPGHHAGQFVPIEVEIDGVRVRRCYSISSGSSRPRARRIAITVKRVPGGRMSTWLHEHLRAGDVIGLDQPGGDFVVAAPGPLLLVAGGSGVTPIMAILRDLDARREIHDVVVIHAARTDADAIFRRELALMADQHPTLRVIAHRDAAHGQLAAASLPALVPDLARRTVYVCGPSGLLDVVTVAAAAVGAPVHHERFVAALPAPANGPAVPVTITLGTRTVAVDGAGSLLGQLERAGERPAHGCRMGICNTCRCRKQTGIVEDLTTGVVSSEPDQDIRLCVSIARSDLELAL